MDDEVRRLARAARATPFDTGIAQAYDRALAQAGHRATLRLRREARFVCPTRFEDGAPTADPFVRRCVRCGPVHFAEDGRRLASLRGRGLGVAIERFVLPFVLADLVEGPQAQGALGSLRGRLHATDLEVVDLDQEVIPVSVLNELPWDVSRTYLALAVRRTPDTLHVALGDPSAEGVLDDLRDHVEVDLRQVLAPRAAVEREIAARPAGWHDLMGGCCWSDFGPHLARHRFLHRRRHVDRDEHRARIADDGWLGD